MKENDDVLIQCLLSPHPQTLFFSNHQQQQKKTRTRKICLDGWIDGKIVGGKNYLLQDHPHHHMIIIISMWSGCVCGRKFLGNFHLSQPKKPSCNNTMFGSKWIKKRRKKVLFSNHIIIIIIKQNSCSNKILVLLFSLWKHTLIWFVIQNSCVRHLWMKFPRKFIIIILADNTRIEWKMKWNYSYLFFSVVVVNPYAAAQKWIVCRK